MFTNVNSPVLTPIPRAKDSTAMMLNVFARVRLRTYFRGGMHWNARGHAVAAQAILEFLTVSDEP